MSKEPQSIAIRIFPTLYAVDVLALKELVQGLFGVRLPPLVQQENQHPLTEP